MDRRTLTRIASALREGRGEYIEGRWYSLAETTMHAALDAAKAPERRRDDERRHERRLRRERRLMVLRRAVADAISPRLGGAS